jgi:glutamine amidotransferase
MTKFETIQEPGVEIAILDYGMGNLRSVEKALEHVGVSAPIVSDAAQVHAADGLILPGVGAFPGRCAGSARRASTN